MRIVNPKRDDSTRDDITLDQRNNKPTELKHSPRVISDFRMKKMKKNVHQPIDGSVNNVDALIDSIHWRKCFHHMAGSREIY